MKDVCIAVFDDADITASSQIVYQHLLNRLSCQKIFVSSHKKAKAVAQIGHISQMKLFIDNRVMPNNIEHYFVKCLSIDAKSQVLRKICAQAYREDDNFGKVMVFFSVSFKIVF